MTYEDIQKMSMENASLKAAITIMLDELKFQAEDGFNEGMIRALIRLGENVVAGRPLGGERP